jgi:type II secretion system (T2SS) protein E
VDPEVLRLVSAELAERYGCLPLFVKEEGGSRALYLGVEDPTDQAVIDDVSFRVGLRILPVVVGPVELRRTLRAAHAQAFLPRTPAAPALPEEPLAVRDTAPELADDSFGADELPGDDEKDEADKPRDVPTREILRAVTRLLLEKEVFSRAELLAAVSAVHEAEDGSSDA